MCFVWSGFLCSDFVKVLSWLVVILLKVLLLLLWLLGLLDFDVVGGVGVILIVEEKWMVGLVVVVLVEGLLELVLLFGLGLVVMVGVVVVLFGFVLGSMVLVIEGLCGDMGIEFVGDR